MTRRAYPSGPGHPRRALRAGGIACIALALAACATSQPPARQLPVDAPLPAGQASLGPIVLHQPRPGLYTSAQPRPGDWRQLPALGVGTVINLRPAEEMAGRDEAAEVRAAGMHYVNIPIAGADAVTPLNARALQQAIATGPGKVLVHCSTGNRAGALLALAAHAGGMASADALAFGKAAGLSGLEPVVRGRLGLPACPGGPDAPARC